MQWEIEPMAGKQARSWTEYRAGIYAQFDRIFQQEPLYETLTEIRNNGNIYNMVSEFDIQKV
jgi:hypothetical protein